MSTSNYIQAVTCLRKSVTIPASGGTASTLSTLASLTADEQSRCIGVRVSGKDTAGSDRAAFFAGDAVGSQLQYVASAATYNEPATRDAVSTFVKSAAAAITNVCVIFYLMGAAE